MRIRTGVALAASFALAAAANAHAATFTVTRTDDPAPGACDSDCSLREAVLAANAAPGVDRIALSAGRIALTIPGTGEDAGAKGDLDLTGELEIDGAGAAASTVDGAGLDRVFDIRPGATVSLLRLTVTGGLVDDSGGGIANAGSLTLGEAAVTGNEALVSGTNAGGAVDSTGALIVRSSTISGNRAYNGGGIAFTGTLTVTNSTVAQNVAGGPGSNGDGGGISGSTGASATLESSTVAANVSFNGPTSGGGLNIPAATLLNTIVAGNLAHLPDQSTTVLDNCSVGVLTSQGHNLSDGSDCNLLGAGDRANGDPRLGALTTNGGPTVTMALLPGSQAIDVGSGCPATDQRGAARPAALCDIGAYEVSPPAPTALPARNIATLSATLVGSLAPSVQPTSVQFEWKSLDGLTTGSSPVQVLAPSAATIQLRVPIGGLKPGTTYTFHLKAANGDGSATSPDLTFKTADRTRPVLTLLKVVPGIFRARKGTTIRFELSEAATVAFRFDRVVNGVRVKGSCLPRVRGRRGRLCTRYVPLKGEVLALAKAGANRIPFAGRLNGRLLAPSAYRLRAQPKDSSGNVGKTVVNAFRIRRP
jgi:CSLREA domain-containing protein